MAAVCAAMAVPFLAFWKPSVPQDVRANGLLSKLTTWMWVLQKERGKIKKEAWPKLYSPVSSHSPYWHGLPQDSCLPSPSQPNSALPFISHLHEPTAEISQQWPSGRPREPERGGKTFLDKVNFIQVHLRHCLALSEPPVTVSILPLPFI